MTKPYGRLNREAQARPAAPARNPRRPAPGLYLIIQPSGAKSWAARYRYAGRSRKFTIGPYPAFDLAAARQEASQALQRAQRGGDPGREKRLERRRSAEAKDDFESVVRLFIERHSKQNNRTWKRAARAFGLVPSNDEPSAAWPAIKGGLVAKWGERKIGDIARIDIIDLLDAIVARRRRSWRIGCSPICASCSTGRWKAT